MADPRPTEKQTQDYSAAYYDVRYSGWGRHYHKALVEELLEDASGYVLDAGCGSGFASQVRPDLDMLGIDISDGMLRKHPGDWIKADAQKMPFADQEFDFILCRSLLHHLPDHKQGLREMHRVLKPGGRISFLETNKSIIAAWIRKQTQHGDRFSEFHRSFSDTELLSDIGKLFHVEQVRYEGYLRYPLYGFPDIINFHLPGFLYKVTGGIDWILSHSPLHRLSWAIIIKARKA